MMLRELMIHWFVIIAIGVLMVWKSPPKTEVNNLETSDETKNDLSVISSELKSESDYERQGK